jgi:hypothetical protein
MHELVFMPKAWADNKQKMYLRRYHWRNAQNSKLQTDNERAIKNETRLYDFRQGQPGLRTNVQTKTYCYLIFNSDLIRKFKLKRSHVS